MKVESVTREMETHLISFADIRFQYAQKRLGRSAIKNGIDHFSPYGPKDLRCTGFFTANRKILEMERGVGYWLWKPYIILDALTRVAEGAIVVYSDAGIEITSHLAPLFSICRENGGVMLFNNCDYVCSHWTKRDCFVLMDCDCSRYWESPHILGSFLVFLKTRESLEFVAEWLKYCSDERILTDQPNTCGKENLPGFVEHRHDQAVLSLLASRKRVQLYRDPTQWGNYLKVDEYRKPGEFLHREYSSDPFINSPYGTLLDHHRNASNGVVVRLAYLLSAVRNRLERGVLKNREGR
jgi:hypothetical protein